MVETDSDMMRFTHLLSKVPIEYAEALCNKALR